MPAKIAEKSYGPPLALIAVQLAFGSLPVVGKIVLTQIPNIAFVGFRVGITAVILYVFQRFRGGLASQSGLITHASRF